MPIYIVSLTNYSLRVKINLKNQIVCLFVDLGLYNDAVELTSRFSEFYKVGVTDQWSTML